jgi:hypothetical protein
MASARLRRAFFRNRSMGGVDNKGLSLVMAFRCSEFRQLARLRRRRCLVNVAIAALEEAATMDVHAVLSGGPTMQRAKLGAREARLLALRCQRRAEEARNAPNAPAAA